MPKKAGLIQTHNNTPEAERLIITTKMCREVFFNLLKVAQRAIVLFQRFIALRRSIVATKIEFKIKRTLNKQARTRWAGNFQEWRFSEGRRWLNE